MITHALLHYLDNGDVSVTLYTQDGQSFSFDEVLSSSVETAILCVLTEKAIRREVHDGPGASGSETFYFV